MSFQIAWMLASERMEATTIDLEAGFHGSWKHLEVDLGAFIACSP